MKYRIVVSYGTRSYQLIREVVNILMLRFRRNWRRVKCVERNCCSVHFYVIEKS